MYNLSHFSVSPFRSHNDGEPPQVTAPLRPSSPQFPSPSGRTNLIFVCVRARSWWGLAFPLDVLSFARLTKSSPQRVVTLLRLHGRVPARPLGVPVGLATTGGESCRNGDCNRVVGRMLALLRSRPLRLQLEFSTTPHLGARMPLRGHRCSDGDCDTVATPACPIGPDRAPTEPQSRQQQPLSWPLCWCTRGTSYLREPEPSVMPLHSVVTSAPSSALTPYNSTQETEPC